MFYCAVEPNPSVRATRSHAMQQLWTILLIFVVVAVSLVPYTASIHQWERDIENRDETRHAAKREGNVFHVGPPSMHEPHSMASKKAIYDKIQSCIDSITQAGDECRIADGIYQLGGMPPFLVSGKHGTDKKPVVIAAEPNANVQFMGTSPVKVASAWSKDESTGAWSAKVLEPSGGIAQLFDGNTMYTPARWPDAFWHDKSMFLGPEHWAHLNASVHNVTTGHGQIMDGGTCPTPPQPTDQKVLCDRMKGLADSGINATGSIIVLNAWACDTAAQKVTHHKPGDNIIYYNATHYNHCDALRNHGLYYLVGKREFVTSPTEWMYDKDTSILYIIPEEGKDIHSLDLQAKDSTWTMNITNSSFLTVGNISFFATALLATDGGFILNPPPHPAPYPKVKPYGFISRLRFEGLRFNYPAASRRMLGETVVPDTATLFAPSHNGLDLIRNMSVYNCTFYGSDGPALLVNTDNFTIEHSLFNYTDWSCIGAEAQEPGRDGGFHTLSVSGNNARAIRNTFANNGNSATFSAGSQFVAYRNHFYGQAELQGDGTYVEGRGIPKARDSVIECWGRDTGKLAFRLDGDSTIPLKVGDGGLFSHNVAINTSGIHTAGNGHVVEYNTAVDGTYIKAGDATVSFMFQKPGDPLNKTWSFASPVLESKNGSKGEGVTALFESNAADAFAQGQSISKNNVIGGFDAGIALRDVWNLDFRPCPDTAIARNGAGAYNASVGKIYWIPGRQLWQPSTPIPQHGSMVARLDTDLMFLGALHATQHVVYFGNSSGRLEAIAHLTGEENLADIGQYNIQAKHRYYWRVDAIVQGRVIVGQTWHFTTGNKPSCV